MTFCAWPPGGADCLNRPDLGALAVGRAADFFAVDLNRIEYIGANHDPRSLPAKVGFSGPVDMTVINGKVVWRNGEFPGLDEMELAGCGRGVSPGDLRRSFGGSPSTGHRCHTMLRPVMSFLSKRFIASGLP